jgi:ABC-type transporter MlaC component
MRFVLPILLAATSTVPAQQGEGKEKGGRMIFQPGATEPIITGTAAAIPAPRTGDQAADTVAAFFGALKADQVNAAYDALVKGTIIAERAEDVTALKSRTRTALDNYGPISGYEVVDEKIVGSSLLRRTVVSLNSDLPLRWRFYFYKSGGAWKLVDLRVDDALVELFEEAGRAKK